MGWFFKSDCVGSARLDNKTAIVTGCNTGIGKETVLEFYKRGARVLLACRDIQRAEKAVTDIKKQTEDLKDTGELVIKQLDLNSFQSVRKCADDILQNEPQIHLLVNNAGVMGCPWQLSEDGFEMHFAVNHLGHFLFTLLLLPRIIRSAPARIVTVSSKAHVMGNWKINFDDINSEKGYFSMRAYGRSKLANILFSNELGKRLQGTGVTTYSLHPGVIQTELTRYFEGSFPWGMWIYNKVSGFLIKTPVEGAQTTLYCSLNEKCANETGLYYSDCSVTTPYAQARNTENAKELWEKSIKYVGLENHNSFVAG